jgi:hypothetical protein
VADFIARYQSTAAEMQRYVDGLPPWVNVWRTWMFLLFTAALLFLAWKREARWLAVTMVVSLLAYNAVSMVSGVGRFPSIAFVVFWTPLLVYFARRFGQLQAEGPFDRVYRYWMAGVVGTLAISLAFDAYNVATRSSEAFRSRLSGSRASAVAGRPSSSRRAARSGARARG